MSDDWKNEREYYLTTLGQLIVDEFNNYNFNITDYDMTNPTVSENKYLFGTLTVELNVSNYSATETFEPHDKYVLESFVYDIIQDYINNTPANRLEAMDAAKGIELKRDSVDINAFNSLDEFDEQWEDVYCIYVAFYITRKA